jgi:hypothetical protein
MWTHVGFRDIQNHPMNHPNMNPQENWTEIWNLNCVVSCEPAKLRNTHTQCRPGIGMCLWLCHFVHTHEISWVQIPVIYSWDWRCFSLSIILRIISCRTWHVWPCFSCPSIIPVGDDAMLNGILQSQHSTSTLSIVSNVGVLRIHADDHCAHPWGHVHQTGKFVGNPTWLAGKSTVGREKTLWMWGSLFPGKKLEGILKLDMEVGIPSLWDVLVSNVYLPNLACRTLLSMGSIPMHLGAVPIRPKSTCIPIFPKLLDAFQLLL